MFFLRHAHTDQSPLLVVAGGQLGVEDQDKGLPDDEGNIQPERKTMDAEEEDENNDRDDQGKDAQDDTSPQGAQTEQGDEPEDGKEQLDVEGDQCETGLTSPLEIAFLAEALPLEEDESGSGTDEQEDDDPNEEPAPG